MDRKVKPADIRAFLEKLDEFLGGPDVHALLKDFSHDPVYWMKFGTPTPEA